MAATNNLSRGVLIVDDHPILRVGLRHVIESQGDLTVCGEAGDAEQALEAIPRLKPDLVLVDLSLPGESGLELIKDLRARNGGVKLLVVVRKAPASSAGTHMNSCKKLSSSAQPARIQEK